VSSKIWQPCSIQNLLKFRNTKLPAKQFNQFCHSTTLYKPPKPYMRGAVSKEKKPIWKKLMVDWKRIVWVSKGGLSGLQSEFPDWENFLLSGDCFLWAVFLQITNVAKYFGYFFTLKKLCFYFVNGLGYILGDFLTDSSGHPVCNKNSYDAEMRVAPIDMEVGFSQDPILRPWVTTQPL
jgi:hypothetical protein